MADDGGEGGEKRVVESQGGAIGVTRGRQEGGTGKGGA